MERSFLENLLEDGAVVDAILLEHGRIVKDLQFQHTLAQSVQKAGGRNLIAIRALLDEEQLKAQEDMETAVAAAVKGLKKENGYLFAEPVRQPYAAGVPAQVFSQEDIGNMSMAEYRRFRKGM